MDGIITAVVGTTIVHLKIMNEDGGVEADPMSTTIGIGGAREAGVHVKMTAGAGEVVVEAEAKIGIVGGTIIRTTKRRRIGILGGMTIMMIAVIGMKERKRRGAIAVAAGPGAEIARSRLVGSIAVEAGADEPFTNYLGTPSIYFIRIQHTLAQHPTVL